MKLLVVSTWLPFPPDNGSRVRAYQLLRHLAPRHAITLLSFSDRDATDDLGDLRDLCKRVEVVTSPPFSGNRLGNRGLLSPVPRHLVQTESSRMRELVRALIQGHDAAIGLQVNGAWYLHPWTGLPRIFEEVEVTVYRENCQQQDLLRRWRSGLTWWKFRRFVRNLVDGFDCSTVVSEAEREQLGAIGCDVGRVHVVPNGTTVPSTRPAASRENRLIYAGSIRYSANLDAVRHFIRDIFPLVRRVRPGIRFVVTGSTEGVDVADLAAVDGVEFTGRLSDIDSAVAESAACVVPLRIGGGTRLKVLQAMALGTPVISTGKGIEGLAVEPGRHVLVADDAPAFAGQVVRVLDDPGLAAALSASANSLVREHYEWGAIGDQLERVVEDAVRGHGSRRGHSRTASQRYAVR